MKSHIMQRKSTGQFIRAAVGAGMAMTMTAESDAAPSTDSTADRPNVLVIIFDQLRHDAFSHRNNPVVKTPNMDRLAAEGIVFNQATCASPVCGPSRAAMLSGCYAYDGKFITRNREITQETPFVMKGIQTVDELLDQDGYHVEYRGKWHCGNKHLDVYKSREEMFGHDITVYGEYLKSKGYQRNTADGYLRDVYTKWTYKAWDVDYMIGEGPKDPEYDIGHGHQLGVIEVKDEDSLTAWTVRKTLKFLDDAPKKPFAITCSVLQPHGPLIATEKYANMYNPAEIQLPKNLNSFRVTRDGKKKPIPERVTYRGAKQFMAMYYGLVKECDDHVGKILDSLKKNGLEENTLVILTADHGEFLASHNFFGKGEFFEEAFRVPMIMRYPNAIKAGQTTESVATGADIGPTILDYCNVTKPEWMHGRSLRGVINGNSDSVEYAYGQIRNEQCLRSTEWKLVINKGKPQTFINLKEDPLELENLLDSEADMDKTAKVKMNEMLALLQNKYKMVSQNSLNTSKGAGKKKGGKAVGGKKRKKKK